MMKYLYLILIYLFLSCEKSSGPPEGKLIASFSTANSSKLWRTGQVINITFLNGSPLQIERVKEVSREWLLYANLEFRFVSLGVASHIRITFDHNNYGKGWSLVGALSPRVSDIPTMSLSSVMGIEGRYLILHEFGHVLGLDHEHLNPDELGVRFKANKVQDFCESKQDMTYAQCLKNYFTKKEKNDLNSSYDKYSIMNYPLEQKLLESHSPYPKIIRGELSLFDKMAAIKMYPNKISLSDVAKEHQVTIRTKFVLGGSCGLIEYGDLLDERTFFEDCLPGQWSFGFLTPFNDILPLRSGNQGESCFESVDEALFSASEVSQCQEEMVGTSFVIPKVVSVQEAIKDVLRQKDSLKASMLVDELGFCRMETSLLSLIVERCREEDRPTIQVKWKNDTSTFYYFTLSKEGKFNFLYSFFYEGQGLHCNFNYDLPQFHCFGFKGKSWLEGSFQFDGSIEYNDFIGFLKNLR